MPRAYTKIGRNPHICPVPGCRNMMVPSSRLCPIHWMMVPEDTRREIWGLRRSGNIAAYNTLLVHSIERLRV